MLIFRIVLIFALMTFDRYLSDRWQSHIWNTFYVHEKCKISDFKFSKAVQQHTEGMVGNPISILLEV